MKYKKTILLTIIIVTTILSLGVLISAPQLLTGNIIINEYTHTQALCNETNFCQDYIITCEGNIIKEISPISGATIQHTQNWIDPRNTTNLC